MTAERNYGVSASTAKAPPKGMSTLNTGSTAMHVMADNTGGIIYQNGNDLRAAIQRAINDGDVTYTIGFYPDSTSLDSTFHNLTVQVKRKGVEVRYRKGYLAVPDSTVTDEERSSHLRNALASPLAVSGIGLAAAIEKTDKPATVRIHVSIDQHDITLQQQGEKRIGSLDLIFVQRSPQGGSLGSSTTPLGLALDSVQYEQVLHDGLSITKTIDLASNSAEVRIAVADRTSGRIGSLILPIR